MHQQKPDQSTQRKQYECCILSLCCWDQCNISNSTLNQKTKRWTETVKWNTNSTKISRGLGLSLQFSHHKDFSCHFSFLSSIFIIPLYANSILLPSYTQCVCRQLCHFLTADITHMRCKLSAPSLSSYGTLVLWGVHKDTLNHPTHSTGWLETYKLIKHHVHPNLYNWISIKI